MTAVRLWAATASYTLLALGLTVGCAVAAYRNVRRYRRARAQHPLEIGEILASDPPASGLPRTWPRLSEIDAPSVAAAYRDYADARRESGVLIGELVALAGSAALGVTIGDVVKGGWHGYPSGGLLLVAAAGLILRNRADRTWTHIAGLYERRRQALEGSSSGAVAPRRKARRRRR